jgi:hypothetical protein
VPKEDSSSIRVIEDKTNECPIKIRPQSGVLRQNRRVPKEDSSSIRVIEDKTNECTGRIHPQSGVLRTKLISAQRGFVLNKKVLSAKTQR